MTHHDNVLGPQAGMVGPRVGGGDGVVVGKEAGRGQDGRRREVEPGRRVEVALRVRVEVSADDEGSSANQLLGYRDPACIGVGGRGGVAMLLRIHTLKMAKMSRL